MQTRFEALAQLCDALRATSSRLERVRKVAAFLRSLPERETDAAVLLLTGRVFSESEASSLNMSSAAVWAALQKAAPAEQAAYARAFAGAEDFGAGVRALLQQQGHVPQGEPLTLAGVYHELRSLARDTGPGSRARREDVLAGLIRRATPQQAEWLAKAIIREMRHGVSEGLLLEAIARAAGVPAQLVRQANMLAGDIAAVARMALASGEAGLGSVSTRVFTPLKPMLAQSAENVAQAMREMGAVALEYKLDGARVQIHKQGEHVEIYSRGLAPISSSLPEVAEEVRAQLSCAEAIVEGEVIPVATDGRPLPFQELMRRFRRLHDVNQARQHVPVRLFLFDLLHLDGQAMVGQPYRDRWQRLEQIAGAISLVPRIVPLDLAQAGAFYQQAVSEGYEGVMVKRLDSLYTPGVRGRLWVKVKACESLDLVIVAADWGYGRRKGWLSNYHLAAVDAETGDLLEVGKTFKGLTDEEFRAMTSRLLQLKTGERAGTVFVRPQVVVEVTFNQLQRSRIYGSGLALRFARISRIRDDKPPDQIDTIQRLREIYRKTTGAQT